MPASHPEMDIPAELLGRVLLLVAHPDDESIGCGALLQRMHEPMVVFATDGAPRDQYFWGKHGSRRNYSRVRQEEARTSLAYAAVKEIIFLANASTDSDLFVDQELYRALPQAVRLLGEVVRRYQPQALLTIPYEGGHPDHDTCSFLTSVLAREHHLPAWEFPLYHRRQTGGLVYQHFVVPSNNQEIVLKVSPQELAVKEKMLAAYASQQPFVFEFDPTLERVRHQHAYDYSQPPHSGTLNYEAWHWPMTGRQVCEAFMNFLQEQHRTAV